jgi:hypothetical protein
MDNRWSELFDHPESEGTSEYSTIFLASYGTEGNFGWVPGFLYLITMCMKPLSPSSRSRVLEYFFHLLSGIIYCAELNTNPKCTTEGSEDDTSLAYRDHEVYGSLWDELLAQLRALLFDPKKSAVKDLPKPEYLSMWHGIEKDCISLIVSGFGLYILNMAGPMLRASEKDIEDIRFCFARPTAMALPRNRRVRRTLSSSYHLRRRSSPFRTEPSLLFQVYWLA